MAKSRIKMSIGELTASSGSPLSGKFETSIELLSPSPEDVFEALVFAGFSRRGAELVAADWAAGPKRWMRRWDEPGIVAAGTARGRRKVLTIVKTEWLI